ncbi:MAG: nitrate reductase molybdenum cofactor assembly chaperone [Roseateles sp.]
MFKNTPSPYTLRVLAALLRYPDAAFRAAIPELQQALRDEAALPKARIDELIALLDRLQRDDPFAVEAEYVDLFDRGRGTALHLFEHVHGDSRERGPAMIDLQQTYEQAGLYLTASELPDHLSVVLEFASTQPPREARAFLGEIAHIVRVIFSALLRRRSPYASVLAAVLELAGERAESVEIPPEPELDEAWAEPEAFGGCSTAGQAKPDQPQPIHIVRKTVHASGAQA